MAKLYNYEAGVGYDKPNVTRYAKPEKKRWEITALNIYKNGKKNINLAAFDMQFT